jgi:hypothetical protein
MRVDSKSCSKPACNPCNLSRVFLARAILSASTSVAIPELSKWLTPDRSTHTSFGHGDCNRARSRSRTAGEESISIRPDRYARVAIVARKDVDLRLADAIEVIAHE